MNPYEMQWSSATPGLLIILLDQSGSMTNKYDDNMTKSEFASKAVNRVINTLIQRNFDGESPKNRAFISVIGYDNYVHELCSGYLKDLDAKPMKKYIADDLSRPSALESLARAFLEMTRELHEQGISHGDLQHGNILVRPDGSLVLVDYDSLYVLGMDGIPDDIKGLQGYQHPARIHQRYRSAYSDFFSELVIYTSIRTLAKHPGLWNKCSLADTETMLFTEKDIQSGGTSEIFRLIESDRDIRYLGRAIKDALRQPSLDRIVPLQDIVKGQADSVVENLSKQWLSQTYQPSAFQSNIDIFNQLAEIASRW